MPEKVEQWAKELLQYLEEQEKYNSKTNNK